MLYSRLYCGLAQSYVSSSLFGARTYTGDDVKIKSDIELADYIVLPNKTVAESNPVVKKVIM